jgi:hypothetical protein
VEPWFAPGVLEHGRVMRNDAEAGGVHVTRVSRLEIDGRISRLHFDYEINDRSGTRRTSEIHELGLFTPDEMTAAFRDAGLDAEYDPAGPSGRGAYLARRPGGTA